MNLYDISNLKNLTHVLKKGQQWAETQKIDASKLAEAKLAPDMLALPAQIQLASNSAKFLLARVAGLEVPVFDDKEKTLDDLIVRAEKTIEVLEAADRKAFEGKESTEIVWKLGGTERKASALRYTQFFAVPNFFFHVVTAYDILRKEGVDVGKGDYLRGSQDIAEIFGAAKE